MTFELLLKELRNGKSFEKICEEQDYNLVECTGNKVRYDTDLEGFLERVGAKVEEFGVGYAVISVTNNKVYEIPYEEIKNRFDSDLENETILLFDINRIYDVTRYYN